MNILNVGIPELLLLGVILLVIFGPDRLQDEAKKAAQNYEIGRASCRERV